MPKQTLTGTIDEQCEFLYNLAQEKMAQGNFTGAVHSFQEILKHRPDYRDTAMLLKAAKRQKSTQTNLLLMGFVGAALFIGFGTWLKVSNDLWFLLLAFVGAVVGFGIGNLLQSLQKRASA
jgi:hypothetical protein